MYYNCMQESELSEVTLTHHQVRDTIPTSLPWPLIMLTMLKAHCVVITAQVDMNFIVICERIMELQPSKKMNLINES